MSRAQMPFSARGNSENDFLESHIFSSCRFCSPDNSKNCSREMALDCTGKRLLVTSDLVRSPMYQVQFCLFCWVDTSITVYFHYGFSRFIGLMLTFRLCLLLYTKFFPPITKQAESVSDSGSNSLKMTLGWASQKSVEKARHRHGRCGLSWAALSAGEALHGTNPGRIITEINPGQEGMSSGPSYPMDQPFKLVNTAQSHCVVPGDVPGQSIGMKAHSSPIFTFTDLPYFLV